MTTGSSIIVMGVSACGKSAVGERIAKQLNVKFIDGDDLHPRANILKMSKGEPLNDEDRKPWLERIRDAAFSLERKNERGIIVCSALKKEYRDQIRDGNENVSFLFLDGSYDLIIQRIQAREGHFMKADMLKSQFNVLEKPDNEKDVMTVSIDATLDQVVERALVAISQFKLQNKTHKVSSS